jgi:hypothetical protein
LRRKVILEALELVEHAARGAEKIAATRGKK